MVKKKTWRYVIPWLISCVLFAWVLTLTYDMWEIMVAYTIVAIALVIFGFREFIAENKRVKEAEAQAAIDAQETQRKIEEEQRKIKEEQCRIEAEQDKRQRKKEAEEIARLAFERAALAFNKEIAQIPARKIVLTLTDTKLRPLKKMPQIQIAEIDEDTVDDDIFPLVSIDVETTGLSPEKDRIVEVSAIRFDHPFQPSERFSTFVNPQRNIPESAYDIHGISDEMVEDAPTFSEIVPALNAFVTGCNFVGHNIFFDLKFLYRAGMDLPENVKYFDTLDLARDVSDAPNNKLTTLCDYYGIYRNNAHSSLSDAYAMVRVLERLLDEIRNY